MPAVPVSLMEPVWEQFAALLPDHPEVNPTHPLGCHRLHDVVLRQYDRMIGLELEDVAVDGCITKAPSGGETAGRSPVDRGKQGLKRSTLTDATGVPLHVVATGANHHDGPLLGPMLTGLERWGADRADTTVHLDRGYDSGVTRILLANLSLTGAIAEKGKPAPLGAGKRWVVERTHAWMNGYGKLRRCTERTGRVVDVYLFLAATFVVTRCLIQSAPAPATAGPADPPPGGSHDAYCRSL